MSVLKKKSTVPLRITTMISIVITIIGFVIFFIPYNGSQVTAYSLYLLASIIFFFLVTQSTTNTLRGKGMLEIVITIFKNTAPLLFVMIQVCILLAIFINHGEVMEAKDASGNLPAMLTTYNYASFVFVTFQVLLLYVYTSKQLKQEKGSHPVIKAIETAMVPMFGTLGSISSLFIGLLYMVITRYITDG